MSGLALTSASSGLTPTARPKDPLAKMLPGPMTTYRDFVAGDEVALFAEVYDNSGKQPHKVDIEATLQRRRRAGGVPDARGARQQRAGRRSRRLRLLGPRAAQGCRPRASTCCGCTGRTRVGDQAEAVARDHHPGASRRRPDERAGAGPLERGRHSTGLDARLAAVVAYLRVVGHRRGVPGARATGMPACASMRRSRWWCSAAPVGADRR